MSKRALVVDDIKVNRVLAMAMLRREGWECEEADCGDAALAKLKGEHGFNIVFLDIKMPGLSGEEVCRILRTDPNTSTLPLVAYTAHALEEERETILALGFNAVLIKPINLSSLKEVLARVLN